MLYLIFNNSSYLGRIFNSIYNVISILVIICFIIIVGFILFMIGKSFKEWHTNNNSPVLTVPATVVSKRKQITSGEEYGYSSYTAYYITFQIEDHDSKEFSVNSIQYNQIFEGDYGDLTFQGTRYHRFNRA